VRGGILHRACLVATLLGAPLAAQGVAFRLPSGLRCILVEKHDQPLIRMELVARWDPTEEPEGRQGMAGFLAGILRQGGAGPYTRTEFNQALDDLGLTYGFESRRDAFIWTLAADSRSQEPALELLADAVFRPGFDAALVEAHRSLLDREGASMPAWERGKTRFLWGLGDLRTELPLPLPPQTALGFDDLQAFRRRILRPERSTLVLHGDLSPSQAKELVFLHFGLWGYPAPPALAPFPPKPAPVSPFLAVLEEHPDIEMWAGSTVRCVPEIRELLEVLLAERAQAASPGILTTCSLDAGAPLLIRSRAGAQGRDGLEAALRGTAEALRTRGFSDKDVDRALFRWRARVAALPLHPADLLSRYQEGALDPAFQRRVEALTARDINAALAAMLAPEALHYLLLGGDAKLIKEAEQAGMGTATLVD